MPRRFRVTRLQGGGYEPALVAQRPHVVEPGIVAGADEAAVAPEQRQVVVERTGQLSRQSFGKLLQPLRRRAKQRCLVQIGFRQHGGDRGGAIEPGAHHVEIARAAALKAEPRQRAQHVGDCPERLADLRRQRRPGGEEGDRVEPLLDARGIAQRSAKALGEQPRSSCRARPVGAGQKASDPVARQRLEQLEIGARRGVDAHGAAFADPLGRLQRRTRRDLRLLDIGDQSGAGREFAPVEGAERFHRGDAEPGAETLLRRTPNRRTPPAAASGQHRSPRSCHGCRPPRIAGPALAPRAARSVRAERRGRRPRRC